MSEALTEHSGQYSLSAGEALTEHSSQLIIPAACYERVASPPNSHTTHHLAVTDFEHSSLLIIPAACYEQVGRNRL